MKKVKNSPAKSKKRVVVKDPLTKAQKMVFLNSKWFYEIYDQILDATKTMPDSITSDALEKGSHVIAKIALGELARQKRVFASNNVALEKMLRKRKIIE